MFKLHLTGTDNISFLILFVLLEVVFKFISIKLSVSVSKKSGYCFVKTIFFLNSCCFPDKAVDDEKPVTVYYNLLAQNQEGTHNTISEWAKREQFWVFSSLC